MKRILYFLFALAVSASAVSCTKEKEKPDGPVTPGGEYLREFSATIAADYGTKARVVVSTGKVSFEDGDEVAVSNGTDVATYTYSAATEKFTSDHPLPVSDAYRAYYPASGYVGAGEGGALRVALPVTQAYDAEAVLKAPMGAVSRDGKFSFSHLCAIIEFPVSAEESLAEVTFSANRSVSGNAVFGGNATLTMEAEQAETVSMTLPVSFVPDASKPVCLVIPAGLYPGGFTLKCTFTSGHKEMQPISRDVVIDAGFIHETELFEVGFFSGGKGTEDNPYKIATVQDLLDLSAYVGSSESASAHFRTDCYRQMADIDFDGETLPSIGNSNSTPSYFEGTYEGNGFKVSNVVISNPNTDKAVGFFGYLNAGAHIDGLLVENPTITSTTWNNGVVVGCIQPSSTALVENCVVTGGSVTSNNTDNGGICGKQMSGTIRGCSYTGTVTATGSTKHRIGGIVGQMCDPTALVDNCRFDGTVTGACGNVGGIVGSMYGSASVTGCSVSRASVIEGGSVADNGINVGGIAGYIDSKTGGKVENCLVEGTIVSHYYEAGGIAGRDQGLVIRGCTFSGAIASDWDESGASGDTYGRLGGICGHIHGTGYVENCQVSGTVGADDKRVSYTGGIVGWLEQGSVTGCSIPSGKTLAVIGKTTVGGIVGQFKNGIVKTCTLDGVSVHASGNNAGGGAGRMVSTASLTNCSLRNATVESGGMCAGGMCGLFSTGGYIAQCTVSGSGITAGTKLAGGILGNMDGCTSAQTSRVERCTVEGGSVSTVAQGIAGGILGGCNTYGIVNLCSVSANVSNNSPSGSYGNVGGIVGWTSTQNILVANCVFYGGELHSDNGTGGGVAGIVGQLNSNANDIGNTTVVNCCAFPSLVSSKAGNIAGIAGYVNTVTIRNCYCPTSGSQFLVDGATSNASRGSIYGWLRGKTAGDPCSGVMEDVYWLSGFKAGNFSGSYTYVKSEQSLTDAQMRNTGAVSRPSTGTAYGSFLETLNAAADAYNAGSPVFGVQAAEWVMGTNGYPVPYGTALAGSGTVPTRKRVSLLGDSITTYQGYTPYPSNYEYPKASSYPDFTSVTQTWWYQLIYNKMSNATLEVNSSYTGTCVQNTYDTGHPGYGFLQRYVELGDPDYIFVNGGTNDISRGLPVGSLDFSLGIDELDTYQFAQAFDKLVRLMTAKYPSAIICIVMGDRYFDGTSPAHAPVVREICGHYSLPCVEVNYGADRPSCRYSNGSNVHPTPAGMTFMAERIYSQLQTIL